MDAWNPGWKSSNILKTTELRTVLLLGTQRAPEADVLDVWGDLHVIILWVAAIPCWLHVKACHHWTEPSRPKVNLNKTLLLACDWPIVGLPLRPVKSAWFLSSPCESTLGPRRLIAMRWRRLLRNHAVLLHGGTVLFQQLVLLRGCHALPCLWSFSRLAAKVLELVKLRFVNVQEVGSKIAKVEAHAMLVSSSSMNGDGFTVLSPTY